MAIESINPANGEVLRRYDALDAEAIEAKIASAAQAFRDYAEIPLEHRALWMKKLAGILEHETEELATLITQEMGKTLATARMEVEKCALACRYYAEHAARILTEEAIATDGNNNYVRWDPLGVILAVMPWNFPFWQVFRFAAPALMAGNVGLLKHASNVPQCAVMIEALVRRAGFPRGMLQTLLIGSEQVEGVLADERIAAVTVTGSEAAGRAVAAQAGWLVKKSVLELGGSDPFVVMPSANLLVAIESAVRARTINNGQSCIAAKRFVVHEAIYGEFEGAFVAAMENLKVGDPMQERTDIGPLATAKLVDELEAQVHSMRLAGGRVLTGGERMMGVGNFFEPTVVVDVPRSAAVYQEEVFGPVAMLFKVASLDEAIEVANDTRFGLAASVWTQDADEKQRLIRELQCGAVFVNAIVASDPRLPFGGIKKSGYGRELSTAGMREFLNAKTVVITGSAHSDEMPLDPTDEELEALLGQTHLTFEQEPVSEPVVSQVPQFNQVFESALKRGE
jgi:succinate-semialdehyde dehydrogenase/glutarate-semialdehyde dehydrogenase